MKKFLSAAVFTAIIAACAHGAGVPVHNMTPYSLGVEYNVMINGHPDLYYFDGSSFVTHLGKLHYSPFKFIRLSAGIGGTHPYAQNRTETGFTVNDGAHMGFSATGGAALFLPKILPVLSLTAGYDGSYLKFTETDTLYSGDDGDSFYYSFNKIGKTIGKLHVPYAGLTFHPSRYLDFEIGGLYRIFDVRKTLNVYDSDDDGNIVDVHTFSTDERLKEFHVYTSLTVHEPESGAYLSVGASAAPTVKSKYKDYEKEFKTKSWLTRSSIWLSIGVILRDPRYHGKNTNEGFSDSYVELKQRQDEMARELQRDIDLEKRQAEEAEEEDGEE